MNDLSHTHMRAAVWHGRNDIRVEQVPLPADPAPGWVQIKVDWCGICGSDLHEYVAGPVFIPVEAPHPLTGIGASASSATSSAARLPSWVKAWKVLPSATRWLRTPVSIAAPAITAPMACTTSASVWPSPA